MSAATVFTWLATVMAGLILLGIWLMEYDRDFQVVAATRLRAPVLCAHALLGVGGLLAWGVYLLTDDDQLAWVTLADLAAVAGLGALMAMRWIAVYRGYTAPAAAPTRVVPVPPERHFPPAVILVHGIFAVVTVALVLYVAFFTES